jgi:hypothetical protein
LIARQRFRNHGYIDGVGYKRKATDNFAAEARKQQARLRIGTWSTEEYKRSAGEELTQCDYSKTLHYT